MPDTAASHYAFDDVPAPGEVHEVAPGVHWLRMPLPFKLDHINLWLLEDGAGWTIVDTGIARPEVRELWEGIFSRHLGGRPVTRIIVTHFHPDHVGLAGWLREKTGAELTMPLTEWAFARMLSQDESDDTHKVMADFYRAAGFGAAQMTTFEGRRNRYSSSVSAIPRTMRRIRDGETIRIGGRDWRAIMGFGHSPEHACLWCGKLRLLISGDQILPRISPNIAVWPYEPDSNPLGLYLESLENFRSLTGGDGKDMLVLPSHDRPFRGLEWRLDQLAEHHRERLRRTWTACAAPSTGMEVLEKLFVRQLDAHQLMFAVGESLAHLHWLVAAGALAREAGPDGVNRFRQVAPFK